MRLYRTALAFAPLAVFENKQFFRPITNGFTARSARLMYDNGLGVTQEYNSAMYWYRKAAEQGNTNAQHQLDEMERINQLKSQIQLEIR
jgi:TPR repeat protein